jgi:hypothetical protein
MIKQYITPKKCKFNYMCRRTKLQTLGMHWANIYIIEDFKLKNNIGGNYFKNIKTINEKKFLKKTPLLLLFMKSKNVVYKISILLIMKFLQQLIF